MEVNNRGAGRDYVMYYNLKRLSWDGTRQKRPVDQTLRTQTRPVDQSLRNRPVDRTKKKNLQQTVQYAIIREGLVHGKTLGPMQRTMN